MTEPFDTTKARDTAAFAFHSVVLMNQLMLEAMNAKTERELIYIILNRTCEFTPYDRALLWDCSGPSPTPLGISGSAAVTAPYSESMDRYREVIGQLPLHVAPFRVELLGGLRTESKDWLAAQGVVSALWIPLEVDGRRFGIWLERWAEPSWTESEIKRLAPLTSAYGNAFRMFRKPVLIKQWWKNKKRLGAIAGVVLLLMLVIRIPLRVVAVCEVVPADPLPMTAPLNGVIEEVRVKPGDAVESGQVLVAYDGREDRDSLVIARREVDAVKADLRRAEAEALTHPDAKGEVARLRHRLKQKEARLALAEYKVDNLLVKSPGRYRVMMGDPSEWRGRPVRIGERVLSLIDPRKTKVRIWVAQSDKIRFDLSRPVRVILSADTLLTRTARLQFVSDHAETTPEGMLSFRAEGHWNKLPESGTELMGLRGTAVLYGERVSLLYWLIRRPLGAVRRFWGI